MSINVTVTGNPVSINRGKMVTAAPNYTKTEFEKRRLMRLEQVRQQSKDIAENVRNKVRKEKRKQIKKIEEEGKEKLRDWQNRKLLELQTQYKEALQEVGVGHKEAETLVDENEIADDMKEQKQQISYQRGQDAEAKLQMQKNKEHLQKSIPIQRKKLIRDIENNRAALISGIKQTRISNTTMPSTKKRKPSTSTNETISESDSLSNPENDFQISPNQGDSSSCLCTEDSEKQHLNEFNLNIPKDTGSRSYQHDSSNHKTSRMITIPSLPQEIKPNSPLDTRISDRIKRRNLIPTDINYGEIIKDSFPAGDLPETNFKTPDIDYETSVLQNKNRQCNCENDIDSFQNAKSTKKDIDKENIPSGGSNIHMCPCAFHNIYCPCLNIKPKTKEIKKSSDNPRDNLKSSESLKPYPQYEIPSKPPVKLKETITEESQINQFTQTSLPIKEPNKVQFYDHSNRFYGEKTMPPNSYVERVSADSMEVIPNEVSRTELNKKMMNREREAHIRGQKALRKERIQKDYEEMLKKLPLLQKKERIAEIKQDKPQYHMSDERLKEVERKKQNEIDNAYNKLFPNLKPAIVTLPTKQQRVPPVTDTSEQVTDIGKWDVDYGEPKIFTAQEVQEIVKAFTGQNPSERRTKLQELLRSLKLHKEQLINEIKLLPKDDSINELINDLNSVDSDDYKTEKTKKKSRSKSERKRRRVHMEKDDSLNSTIESSFSSSSTDEKKRHQKALNRKHKTDPKQSNLSTHKKAKKKSKQFIILQNTSTQTSPKVTANLGKNGNSEKPEVEDKQCTKTSDNICTKLHIPCDCNLNAKSEDLCKIVIKLDENEPPQVIVKSKGKEPTSSSDEKIKQFKSVAVNTTKSSIDQDMPQQIIKPLDIRIDKKNKNEKVIEPQIEKKTTKVDDSKFNKTRSWKEQLSKNSISTTSTSYMSPPDFQKTNDKTDPDKFSFYNLRNKPQQKNVTQPKTVDPQKEQTDNIEFYINKLLSMSRQSIENLNVSSCSSVPTPSQSVIEIESNNPQSDLHNLIKYYANNMGDIAEQLSYSPDHRSVPYNTSASNSQKSLDKEHSDLADQMPEKDVSNKPQETLLKQYEHITDSCSKRIANLAEMIKQIREEKVQMLQTPLGSEDVGKCKCPSPVNSEKDFSTAYMDLPDTRESGSSKQSSSSSFDEEEMLKKLMEIDLSLAKKLRKINERDSKSGEVPKRKNVLDAAREVVDPNETNREIIARLERLQQQEAPKSATEKSKVEESAFVSFLSDIPKLPIFEPQLENGNTNNHNHKRPPPSKGLMVARKFNDNISLVPHELSTIVEADSQLSARIPSPNASRISLNSLKDIDVIIIPNVQGKSEDAHLEKLENELHTNYPERNFKSPTDNKMVGPLSTCEDATCNKLTGESATFFDLTKFESSSSDDIDSIEAMLKSIGMEWAIPTLHKTQEALALTSSSSSSSYSAKMKLGNTSSYSNLSLKGFLHKQFLNKVSSSTLISDTSPASLLSEFSDLSAIHPSSSSAEKSQRKTSTPITTSKSTSKSKEILLYSGESDISSVK